MIVPSAPTDGGALAAKFVAAQDRVYPDVLRELRAGRKTSHWMWFIFPQLAGLGHSDMAQRFALRDLAEARAYADHPVLGARLRECVSAVLLHAPDAAATRSLAEIFGYPDDLKFISSMTLFARAVPGEKLFARALSAFNKGEEDQRTLDLL
jgi:uncharacterized protein (DUF1810 family)